MATAMEEHVKETLKCKVCYETLTDPRALPCMHTYCCKCLDKLEKIDQGQKQSLSCPECRQIHTIPEGGVAKFKVNFTTSSLVDLIQSMDIIGDNPNCTVCKEDGIDNDALTKCVQCNEQLCKDCDRSHTRYNKGHTVLDLTGDKTQDRTSVLNVVKQRVVYCEMHKTNPLEIYCKVDQCAVCATCYVIDHSGHECVDVHKAAVNNMELIDELLEKGDKLVQNFEESIQNTHKKKDIMEQEADDVTHELNNDMNTAIQAIRDKYTKHIDLVAEKKATCAKQAVAHLGHLHMQKATTESTMSQLRALKQHGHDTQLANMANDISSKSKEWSELKDYELDNYIKFKIHRGEVFDDRIVFGKVDIDILRYISETLRLCEKPTVLKKVKSNVGNVWDLDVTDNNETVANGSGKSASVYDKDLTLKTTFGKGFYNATCKSNDIYLTSETDTVHVYSKDGTHSRDIRIPSLGKCRGLVVNSRGELVICDTCTKNVYHVESATSKILTKSNLGTLNRPLYVAVNSKDVVLVSDIDGHCVVGMTRDGNELFRYGTLGNGQNQLYHPWGLCTDRANNIIVADSRNHRVHLLSPDGKFIKYLLQASDGLERPYAVAVDKEGQLLVGDNKGYIWHIKYAV
ncbi:unnamed protein product [Owenia fusiformis]|uniref:Uncharacterized protein n=1 Tax=Owenia fusiformis TaxID=6347 RepID=A0A8J1TXU9_OWEFU|nr:unnamed protein product [Owenia fusiformis]